ncbi:glycosyl transferase family 2, partial [Acinetobacter baumannii]
YAQLRYSPLLLIGTLAGLALTYLAPPLLALFGNGYARIEGALAWLIMAITFQPMLRFYRRSPFWGAALPAIAGYYGWCTFASARAHWQGKG